MNNQGGKGPGGGEGGRGVYVRFFYVTVFITERFKGIGGDMRTYPEDFSVCEIPAYDITGQGEHIFVEVSKKKLTTQAVIEELARILEIRPQDIGHAGLKDRQAVTSQRLSLPETVLPQLQSLAEHPVVEGREGASWRIKILGRHNNKLRPGHLQGNHFCIRLRNVDPQWPELVTPIAAALSEHGFANFYGTQRFGHSGNNAEIGLKSLREGKVFGPKWRKWLMISALQSQLFNDWLENRIRDGLFETALVGDVFGKLPQGGIFYSLEPANEQPRLEAFEMSPMGPIFGYKMFKAQAQAWEREQAVLDRYDVKLEDFRRLKAEGSRRRCRLKIDNLKISNKDGDPLFEFTLPAGSYASVLLDEFMKNGSSYKSSEDEAEA